MAAKAGIPAKARVGVQLMVANPNQNDFMRADCYCVEKAHSWRCQAGHRQLAPDDRNRKIPRSLFVTGSDQQDSVESASI